MTKLRDPNGLQLEVGARRAPRLLVLNNQISQQIITFLLIIIQKRGKDDIKQH